MDPNQVLQFTQILQSAQRLNLQDPNSLARAKKICTMAKDLQNNPKYKPLAPELNAELMKFMDSVGARPEVAGLKTTVQGHTVVVREEGGNRWEALIPARGPFGTK